MSQLPAWSNWAHTVQSRPAAVHTPADVDELRGIVAGATRAGMRVKAVGAGHSFTAIAATDGALVRMERLSGIRSVDAHTGLVTVAGGAVLHRLNRSLWQHGLAMTNLGDIDVQTISGAISTGTHGTGARLGGLATQVRGVELVTAGGELLTIDADHDAELLPSAALSLGALGIVTAVTLQCEPAYALAAAERPASLGEVLADLGELVDGNDHFEFFWFPHTQHVLTKRNNRVRPGTELRPLGHLRAYVEDELLANTVFEGVNRFTTRWPATIPRINGLTSRALSARDYIDRSYRVFASPRRVRFREMEYALPRAAVPEVLREIERYLARSGEQLAFPVEVRFAAADDLWLSTAHGRESGYVAVHQYHRRDHRAYFDAVERIARAYDGRPHWGKLHERTEADLRPAYPRFDDFLAVRDRLDPDRVFGNDHLSRVLGP